MQTCHIMQAQLNEVFKAAVQGGVTFFDTAEVGISGIPTGCSCCERHMECLDIAAKCAFVTSSFVVSYLCIPDMSPLMLLDQHHSAYLCLYSPRHCCTNLAAVCKPCLDEKCPLLLLAGLRLSKHKIWAIQRTVNG